MGVEIDEHGGDLIRRIAGGDRRAFERLYERYAQLVLNVAARILRNSEDAEEVVQEVFWQVWCCAGRYDPVRGVPEAWLMTLTRTRAIDLMRASRRPATVGAEALADIPADPGCEEIDAPAERLVTAAMQELSVEQRQALELAYYEGLTHTEIAARVGAPLGTVKTWANRKYKRLF